MRCTRPRPHNGLGHTVVAALASISFFFRLWIWVRFSFFFCFALASNPLPFRCRSGPFSLFADPVSLWWHSRHLSNLNLVFLLDFFSQNPHHISLPNPFWSWHWLIRKFTHLMNFLLLSAFWRSNFWLLSPFHSYIKLCIKIAFLLTGKEMFKKRVSSNQFKSNFWLLSSFHSYIQWRSSVLRLRSCLLEKKCLKKGFRVWKKNSGVSPWRDRIHLHWDPKTRTERLLIVVRPWSKQWSVSWNETISKVDEKALHGLFQTVRGSDESIWRN